MNEVKNLRAEIRTWVTEKKDALEICAELISRFEITSQDFVDAYNKARRG